MGEWNWQPCESEQSLTALLSGLQGMEAGRIIQARACWDEPRAKQVAIPLRQLAAR